MLLTRQLRTQVTLILTTQAVMDYKDRRVSGNYEVLTPKSEAVYKQHFNLIGFFFCVVLFMVQMHCFLFSGK